MQVITSKRVFAKVRQIKQYYFLDDNGGKLYFRQVDLIKDDHPASNAIILDHDEVIEEIYENRENYIPTETLLQTIKMLRDHINEESMEDEDWNQYFRAIGADPKR